MIRKTQRGPALMPVDDPDGNFIRECGPESALPTVINLYRLLLGQPIRGQHYTLSHLLRQCETVHYNQHHINFEKTVKFQRELHAQI